MLATRCAARGRAGRPAFIPFLTAGDPSLTATGELVDAVIQAGADVVEIGFPYSDPLADGPVIQASYTRALRAGCRLASLLEAARTWTASHPETPFVAMAAYSIAYRRGIDDFLAGLKEAGFAGLILPDLPIEEAEAVRAAATARGLDLIQLVTPTTPLDRARSVAECGSGFLYVVSVTGVTGARRELPQELIQQLEQLRGLTTLPLCVGFGISAPDQAALLRPHVDGVIVGSALVRLLEQERPWPATVAEVRRHVAELRAALGP
ncbi:MAG TPA: tryptophan synthase subunit alpha [Gemmatales bacterium]|nr:tryptophan synthase subunit alpha [Gemmatales bacterium]